MKNILLIAALWLLPSLVFGQFWFPKGGGTLTDYENLHKTDIFDPCDTCTDALENSPDETFAEQIKFFKARLRPTDSLNRYGKALTDYFNSSPTQLTSKVSANTDGWVEIGPTKPMTIGGSPFGIGPVEFVSFYPGNTDVMLCGNTQGGVFLTVDGGANWNVANTDNIPNSTSGVKSAVFDPGDVNTWFIANSGLGDLEATYLFYQPAVHRTTNAGSSYVNIFDWTDAWNSNNSSCVTTTAHPGTGNNPWLMVNKLLIDPSNHNKLYVATNVGLFKTSNALTYAPSWQMLPIPYPTTMTGNSNLSGYTFSSPVFINDVEFKPGTSSTIYVSAYFYATKSGSDPARFQGVMKSTDGGCTWAEIANFTAMSVYTTISHAAIPGTSPTQYNWKNREVITIACDPVNVNDLYAIMTSPFSQYGSVYKLDLSTSNAGTSIGSLQVQSGIGEALAAQNGKVVYSNNTGTSIYSPGQGTAYSQMIHVDHEYAAFNPTDNNELWVCTHGGPVVNTLNFGSWPNIFSSTQLKEDGIGVANSDCVGDSYSEEGFLASGFWHMGVAITDPSVAYGTSTWGEQWKDVMVGDGLRALINPQDGNKVIGSMQTLQSGTENWLKTSDKYVNSSNPPTMYASDFYNEAAINRVNPNMLFFVALTANGGYSSILRSSDFGATIDGALSSTSTNTFLNLVQALSGYSNVTFCKILTAYTPPSASNYLYVHVITSSPNGLAHLIFRTTHADDPTPSNVWSTWEYCPSPYEAGWISELDFDVTNPNIVYILNGSANIYNSCVGCAGTKMVYKMDYTTPSSHSSGSCTSGICTDLTLNLPNIGVGGDGLAIEKGSNGGIYVSTDVGVFYTNNSKISAGSNWQLFGTALPCVKSRGVDINYKVNKIRIGTYGRGFWEHDLFCPPNYDLTESSTYGSAQFKEAEHDLNSTATVNGNFIVEYRAGNLIDLKPGFSATGSSTYFHGYIHACNHAGNSFNRYSKPSMPIMEQYSEQKRQSENESPIIIIPNSNDGSFVLGIKKKYNPVNNVEIFDITGRLIYSKSNISENERFNLNLENGTYLLKYYDGIYADSQALIISK